jgi:hypothetical protein
MAVQPGLGKKGGKVVGDVKGEGEYWAEGGVELVAGTGEEVGR